MGLLIQVRENLESLIEKRALYRFWDKERERSNHAEKIAAGEPNPFPCPHLRIGWSGPPHDKVQAVTCLDCGGHVTEPEVTDRGFDFNDCPDWVVFDIMDGKRRLLRRR